MARSNLRLVEKAKEPLSMKRLIDKLTKAFESKPGGTVMFAESAKFPPFKLFRGGKAK